MPQRSQQKIQQKYDLKYLLFKFLSQIFRIKFSHFSFFFQNLENKQFCFIIFSMKKETADKTMYPSMKLGRHVLTIPRLRQTRGDHPKP